MRSASVTRKEERIGARVPSMRKATSMSAAETMDTVSARGSTQSIAPTRSDDELVATASQLKQTIDWSSVVLSARTGPGRWHRHETESNEFAVYTRQQSQQYGVLAVGLVRASAIEVVNTLQAANTHQYQQQMHALHGNHFQSGSLLHRVSLDNVSAANGSELRELTLKTATFTKSGWFSDPEEWTYLDALYRDSEKGVVEKYMATVDSKTTSSASSTKILDNIVCGYLLRPGSQDSNQAEVEIDHGTTRVSFYAEFALPKHVGISISSASTASDKAIKARLLKMAESTARLTSLVRRHRLAMQTLVNRHTFLPPTNTPCMVCTRILRIAKLCRLCGQGVCGNCSAKHERVSRSSGSDRLRVDRVRVCANCMERVDQAEYSHLSTSSLFGPRVVPDSNNATPASTLLSELLLQALADAPSPTRRCGVISVIKALVNQDTLSPPTQADDDYAEALARISVGVSPVTEAGIRSDESRSYPLNMRVDPAHCLEVPVPRDEDTRVAAVGQLNLSELGEMPELSIICDLAAKELGCSTSAINILDRTTQRVIASNIDELRNLVVPRNQAMCSHTIMENSAHIVVNPEADIRFSKVESVKQFGVKYYCGLPLLAEDGQILGAMCCINQEAVVLTESQFATFKKLVATAEKIVRMHTRKRAAST